MWPYLSGLGGTVPWLSGTFEVAFGSGQIETALHGDTHRDPVVTPPARLGDADVR